MGWQVIQLPFGADRDRHVLDVVRGFIDASEGPAPRREASPSGSAKTKTTKVNQRILCLCESRGRARYVKSMLAESLSMAPAGLYGTIDDVAIEIARNALFPNDASCGAVSAGQPGYVAFPSDHQARRLVRDAMIQSKELRGRSVGAKSIDEMQTALDRVRNTLPRQQRLAVLEELVNALAADDAPLASRIRAVRDALIHVDSRLHQMSLDAGQWIVDRGEAEWLAASYPEHAFAGYGLVIVEDVYRLGPAQGAFVDALSKLSRAVWIARGIGGASPYERVLPTTPTDATVVSRGPSAHEASPSTAPATSNLSKERQALLDALLQCRVVAPESAQSTRVLIANVSSPSAEARAVVARAKALHVLNGVPLNEMAICLVDKAEEEAYAIELETAGVPFARSAPVPATHAPIIQSLFGLIDAAAGGWAFEDTFRALNSPWLDQMANLIADSKGWNIELAQLAKDARDDSIYAPILLGGQGARITKWRPMMEAYSFQGKTLWERWLPITTLLDSLSDARTPRSLARRLLQFCASSGIADKAVRARKGAHAASESFVDASRVLWNVKCLDKVIEVLRDEARSEETRETSFAHAWVELRDSLSSIAAPIRKASDAVHLFGLLDLRGLPLRHIFLCGLHAGAMPFPDPENAFFPRRLNELRGGGRLSASAESALFGLAADLNPLDEYRHLLACALGNGPDGIVCTWPRSTSDGEAAPSLPIRELMAALGVQELGQRDSNGDPWQVLSAADCGHLLQTNPSFGLRESKLSSDTPQSGREFFSPRDLHTELGRRVSTLLANVESTPIANAKPVSSGFALEAAMAGAAVNISRDELLSFDSPWAGRLRSRDGRTLAYPKRVGKSPDAPATMSPSRLEGYAKCPTRYLLQNVMGLEEADRVSDGLDVMGRGSFVHGILEEFVLQVRSRILAVCPSQACYPGELLGWSATQGVDEGSNSEDYREAARKCLKAREVPLADLLLLESVVGAAVGEELMLAALDKYAGASPSIDWQLWIARERAALKGSGTKSQLATFLAHERYLQARVDGQPRVIPWLVEAHVATREAPWVPDIEWPGGESPRRVGFAGKADRIDVLLGLTSEGGQGIGIVVRDYKSSKGSNARWLKQGLAFQLPLYSLASEELLGGAQSPTSMGFFIHVPVAKAPDENKYERLEIDAYYVPDEVAIAMGKARGAQGDADLMMREVAPDRIRRIFGAMDEGYYHPALAIGSNACTWCHLQGVCAVRMGQQDILSNAGDSVIHLSDHVASEPYFPSEDELEVETDSGIEEDA